MKRKSPCHQDWRCILLAFGVLTGCAASGTSTESKKNDAQSETTEEMDTQLETTQVSKCTVRSGRNNGYSDR